MMMQKSALGIITILTLVDLVQGLNGKIQYNVDCKKTFL